MKPVCVGEVIADKQMGRVRQQKTRLVKVKSLEEENRSAVCMVQQAVNLLRKEIGRMSHFCHALLCPRNRAGC